MAGRDGTVRIAAVADTRQLKRDMQRAQSIVGKFGDNVKGGARDLVGAFAIGSFIAGGLNDLKEQQKVAAQTAVSAAVQPRFFISAARVLPTSSPILPAEMPR